jgi:hypothetical protein
MKLNGWQRIGIIGSVTWVAVGPTYFHLSQEDNARRIARDQYQRCIQNWAAQEGGVERCNKNIRRDLAFAHWSSWAQLAFIPVVLAWFVTWGLFFLMRRVRSRPQVDSRHYQQTDSAEGNDEYSKKHFFPAPWTVEKVQDGFKVVDANGQSLAYVYFRENPNDAQIAKTLTEDEAQDVASNIAKLPLLLSSR